MSSDPYRSLMTSADIRLVRLNSQHLAAFFTHPAYQVFLILVHISHVNPFRHGVFERLAEGLVQSLFTVILQPEITLYRIIILFAVGTCHTLRHGIIKVRHRLSAVHLVLVCLNGDAGQRRIALDRLWLPDISVPGGKTSVEQFQKINLAAGLRQHIKIFIVDMDVSINVGSRDILGQNIIVHKIIGPFGPVFQHRTHGRVGVYIGVFSFNIRICRAGERQLPVDLDQIRFRLTQLRMLLPVEDICLCRFGKSVLDQFLLDQILYLLHIGSLSFRNRFHDFIHQFFKLIRGDRFHPRRVIGFPDRIPDFLHIERHRNSVSLFYHFRAHDGSFPHNLPSTSISGIFFYILR